MKKINLTIAVFLLLISFCFALTFSTFFSTAEVSEKENRKLQQIPSFSITNYLNGSFFKDLESFFYDHFPYRDNILEMVTVYDKLKGIQPEIMALEKGNNMNLVNTETASETEQNAEIKEHLPSKDQETVEESQTSLEKEQPDFSEYKTQTQNLSIMAVKDTLLELYQFNEKHIQSYAEALNLFAAKIPQDVKLYSLLAPTQVGLTDDEYRDYSDPQEKAIEYAYSLLDERYQTISVFPVMYEKRDEYLYFRSDHHWTQLGAYYAAQTFARQAGLSFRPIEDYQKYSFEGFLGYLYHNNQVEKVAQNPDRIDAYTYFKEMPVLKNYYYKKDGSLAFYSLPLIKLHQEDTPVNYGIFLGGDFPTVFYENPNPGSGRILMIVKDSYANAFVPWIAENFDKIIVIDPRFYKEDIYELIQQTGTTDFMVLDYIMVTRAEEFARLLKIVGTPKEI